MAFFAAGFFAASAAGLALALFTTHLPLCRWVPFLQDLVLCAVLCTAGLAGVAAVAGVAGLLLAAGLCVAWLASQGGGRTPRLARDNDGDSGTTVVDTGLVAAAVSEALAGNRLVLGSTVSAWESRHGTGLRLRLQARKGASPRELADTAEELIRGIDGWLGHPVPVLVRITGGARSRLAGVERTR